MHKVLNRDFNNTSITSENKIIQISSLRLCTAFSLFLSSCFCPTQNTKLQIETLSYMSYELKLLMKDEKSNKNQSLNTFKQELSSNMY